MAHAMDRLFATPKTMPNLPASKDMVWLNCFSLVNRHKDGGNSTGMARGKKAPSVQASSSREILRTKHQNRARVWSLMLGRLELSIFLVVSQSNPPSRKP